MDPIFGNRTCTDLHAHNGAYSFPDESTLFTLSPPNLTVGCVQAP